MKNIRSYITLRNIAAFILILFCIQYIPIESRGGVSYVKLAVSMFCPFIFILYSPKINRATILLSLYYVLVVFTAIFHPDTLRWSTLLYLLTFLVTYLAFYNLIVEEHVFSADYFIKLLKGLILAYFITLLIQQAFIIIGIKYFPLINLAQVLNRGIGANSLSYEPSTAAMVLAFSFLSLLRMLELRYGRKLSIKEIFVEAKWSTIGFLWSMLTMGSGTAFIALGILLLYFIKRRYALTGIPLLIIFYVCIQYIDFEPLNRAVVSFESFLTLDNTSISRADGSAAARIVPLANFLTKLDLTTVDGWFGHGVDYSLSKGLFSDQIMIGGIADYGFLSFVILQILVYTCMIKKIFSLETLMWVGISLATLQNEPFRWGVMMLFTVVRFFQTQDQKYKKEYEY